jgi:hypothetical protein
MKKVLVLLVVLAMVVISSVAFAADVTVGGSVQLRSRNFDFGEKNQGADQVDTQERIMIDINAKAGDVKGKISLWNDFDTWGRFESTQGSNVAIPSTTVSGTTNTTTGVITNANTAKTTGSLSTLGFREAWLLFPLADTGFMVKGGHQLLQLGHGGFFRSQHFGSDAWVAYRDDGGNHFGIVNVKIAEAATNRSDDTDAYVLVDTFKIDDNNKVGIDITSAQDRGDGAGNLGFGGRVDAMNVGLNYTGKVGSVNLKAEADLQSGTIKAATGDVKLKGNEIFVMGDLALNDAAKVNFTVARGSGNKSGSNDVDAFVNFLDIDPHYTLMYEYKRAGACGALHQGFCNTTALNVGGSYNVSKNLSVSLNGWFLTATEKLADLKAGSGTTNDVGTEVDAKITWKLGEGLTWTWDLGMLNPGKGIDADGNTETGIQGILAFTF